MKIKVNWKELGKALWAAVKRALLRPLRGSATPRGVPPSRCAALRRIVLLAAIGISTGRRPQLLLALSSCGIVSVATGCSSLVPTSKTQTLSVVGIGIPAIAVVSSSSQGADATGGDENKPTQTNPVTTVVPISTK